MVETFAGSSEPGLKDGQGSAARFAVPVGIDVATSGAVIVSDVGSHTIRRISPSGYVTTLAGGGEGYVDGPAEEARFRGPHEVVITETDGAIVVADRENHAIRVVQPDGHVGTLAARRGGGAGSTDGPPGEGALDEPIGLAFTYDNRVLIAEAAARIRGLGLADGRLSTIAGGGAGFTDATGRDAQFALPYGLATDQDDVLYVADRNNHAIRKITPNGKVSTIAGTGTAGFRDGPIATAQFDRPTDVAVDKAGNLFVTDSGNRLIRVITINDKRVYTVAGSGATGHRDGAAATAEFALPLFLALDVTGTIYVSDANNHVVRKIVP